MKTLIPPFVFGGSLVASLLSVSPARAQWVAQPAQEVPGHSKQNANVSNGSPSLIGSITQFQATVEASGTGSASNNYPEGSVDFADQWTQSYQWTGTGTGQGFLVNVANEVDGSSASSAYAFCDSSGSAGSLGGMTTTANDSFQKNPGGQDVQVSAGSPSLTVTVEATASGRIYYHTGATFDAKANA